MWIKRGTAKFGPLEPEEVIVQWEQGVILEDDLGCIGRDGTWQPMTLLIQRLCGAKRLLQKQIARTHPSQDMATAAQVLRMRSLGLSELEARRLSAHEAEVEIARLEAILPAGRALLTKMQRLGLPAESGIVIAEAKRRIEAASLRHYLTMLEARNIPHTQDITAAQAEELAEVGPPTVRQMQVAAEMELEVPPNMGQRSLDRYLAEAASAETGAVEEFYAVALRSTKCRGIGRQQVRNVIRYLNAHYPDWRKNDAERQFISFVVKFYPHLGGGTRTTRFLGPET